jgi:hypothetical protein
VVGGDFGRTGEKGTPSHPCHLGYRQPWCPQARRRLNELICALWPVDGGGGWRPSTCPSHGPCMCPHARERAPSAENTNYKHTCLFSSRVCEHTEHHHHCPLTPAVLSPRLAVCKSKMVICVVYPLLSLLAREAGGRKGLAGARGTSEQDETPRKFASLPISRLRLPIPASLSCVSTLAGKTPTIVIQLFIRSLSLLIWTKARDPLCTLVHTRCFIRFGSCKITNFSMCKNIH